MTQTKNEVFESHQDCTPDCEGCPCWCHDDVHQDPSDEVRRLKAENAVGPGANRRNRRN